MKVCHMASENGSSWNKLILNARHKYGGKSNIMKHTGYAWELEREKYTKSNLVS
jgi:hypothetical protein